MRRGAGGSPAARCRRAACTTAHQAGRLHHDAAFTNSALFYPRARGPAKTVMAATPWDHEFMVTSIFFGADTARARPCLLNPCSGKRGRAILILLRKPASPTGKLPRPCRLSVRAAEATYPWKRGQPHAPLRHFERPGGPWNRLPAAG